MKKIIYLFMSALIIAMLASCSSNVQLEDTVTPETEPTPQPAVTLTPEPQAGESFDYHRELVTCRVNKKKKDTKDIWKVKSPTETPDPMWVVEATDGDIVTYSRTYCDHIGGAYEYIPCQINPNEQDRIIYTTITKEHYVADGDHYNFGEIISDEDGLVTYREYDCSESHKYIITREVIPCHLCPESGLEDIKEYRKVHISGNKPGKEYTLEGTDGDWELYSRITECNDYHKSMAEVYAAREQAAADNAE